MRLLATDDDTYIWYSNSQILCIHRIMRHDTELYTDAQILPYIYFMGTDHAPGRYALLKHDLGVGNRLLAWETLSMEGENLSRTH